MASISVIFSVVFVHLLRCRQEVEMREDKIFVAWPPSMSFCGVLFLRSPLLVDSEPINTNDSNSINIQPLLDGKQTQHFGPKIEKQGDELSIYIHSLIIQSVAANSWVKNVKKVSKTQQSSPAVVYQESMDSENSQLTIPAIWFEVHTVSPSNKFFSKTIINKIGIRNSQQPKSILGENSGRRSELKITCYLLAAPSPFYIAAALNLTQAYCRKQEKKVVQDLPRFAAVQDGEGVWVVSWNWSFGLPLFRAFLGVLDAAGSGGWEKAAAIFSQTQSGSALRRFVFSSSPSRMRLSLIVKKERISNF
ncbi:uncharacterized protein G2W53_027906 [Senna tora]|uniref:Uncharacterized protein n=1 Tax=Senna tora TaxID=362788 RepID=A0A834TJU7_9FABA|nr:uncharacterized protein G2W53_027906 [Senna tora]